MVEVQTCNCFREIYIYIQVSDVTCNHKPLIETHDLLRAERLWLSAQVTAMEKWSLLGWVQYRGLIGCKFGDVMRCYECMGIWYDVVRNVFSKLYLMVVWNFRWWKVAQLLQTTPNSDLVLASREMCMISQHENARTSAALSMTPTQVSSHIWSDIAVD